MITTGKTAAFPLKDAAHVRLGIAMLPWFQFVNILERFLVYARIIKACAWHGVPVPSRLLAFVPGLSDTDLCALWKLAVEDGGKNVTDEQVAYIYTFIEARCADPENHPHAILGRIVTAVQELEVFGELARCWAGRRIHDRGTHGHGNCSADWAMIARCAAARCRSGTLRDYGRHDPGHMARHSVCNSVRHAETQQAHPAQVHDRHPCG